MSYYSLTVLAIDKGTPPKTATATVSIKVTDVNNKAPVITSSILQTSILENSTKGSEVKAFFLIALSNFFSFKNANCDSVLEITHIYAS